MAIYLLLSLFIKESSTTLQWTTYNLATFLRLNIFWIGSIDIDFCLAVLLSICHLVDIYTQSVSVYSFGKNPTKNNKHTFS